jgi:outer membrane protein assembly factor BamD
MQRSLAPVHPGPTAMVDDGAVLTYHRFLMSRLFHGNPGVGPSASLDARGAGGRPPSPRWRAGCGLALLITTLALALMQSACASGDEATKPITYSLTAKQNYEKGLAELKDENYPEAQKYFQFVKQKFPFSKFAVLAELAIADTQFARGNYTEAVDSYKAFIRLHPTHEKVEDGYAAFKVGECYYKDMPDDIWLLPPSYEKDQSAVTDALRELDDFRKKYPESKYQKTADPLRKEVLKRLVDHEVYIARFYLNRDHAQAAAKRLEGAIKRYPGSGREPELLFALGQTYLQMGDPLRSKDSFTRVVSDFPGAPQARRSELYLEFIQKRFGENPQAHRPDAPLPATPASVPANG